MPLYNGKVLEPVPPVPTWATEVFLLPDSRELYMNYEWVVYYDCRISNHFFYHTLIYRGWIVETLRLECYFTNKRNGRVKRRVNLGWLTNKPQTRSEGCMAGEKTRCFLIAGWRKLSNSSISVRFYFIEYVLIIFFSSNEQVQLLWLRSRNNCSITLILTFLLVNRWLSMESKEQLRKLSRAQESKRSKLTMLRLHLVRWKKSRQTKWNETVACCQRNVWRILSMCMPIEMALLVRLGSSRWVVNIVQGDLLGADFLSEEVRYSIQDGCFPKGAFARFLSHSH